MAAVLYHFHHQAVLARTTHKLAALTKNSELRSHYQQHLDLRDPTLTTLASMELAHNPKSRLHEDRPIAIQKGLLPNTHSKTLPFNNIPIPTSCFTSKTTAKTLWGQNYWPTDALLSQATYKHQHPKANLPLAIARFLDTPTTIIPNKRRPKPGKDPLPGTIHHPHCPDHQIPLNSNPTPLLLALSAEHHTKHTLNHPCCKHLWLERATSTGALNKVHAHTCTDGSTYPNKLSAAALVYMDDDIHTKELWQIPGTYWTIPVSNNYAAELAAIGRSLHAVPITVNLTIHTDSLSSIQAINKYETLRNQLDLSRCAARPYLLHILHAIALRKAAGATTTLRHVKSHTGKRDKPSLGNAEADYLAKWQALIEEGPTNDHFDPMTYELPYTLNQITTKIDANKGPQKISTPMHDDIRKSLRAVLQTTLLNEWSERPTRGALPALQPKAITELINDCWKQPTSSLLKFLVEILTQSARRDPNTNYTTTLPCHHCGTHEPATATHRILTCPTIAHLWNENLTQNLHTLKLDPLTNPPTTPLSTSIDKLTKSFKLPRRISDHKHIPHRIALLTELHHRKHHQLQIPFSHPPTQTPKPLKQRRKTGAHKGHGYLHTPNDPYTPLTLTYPEGPNSAPIIKSNTLFPQGAHITPISGIITTDTPPPAHQPTPNRPLLELYHIINPGLTPNTKTRLQTFNKPEPNFGLGQFCALGTETNPPNATIRVQPHSAHPCAWIQAIQPIPLNTIIRVDATSLTHTLPPPTPYPPEPPPPHKPTTTDLQLSIHPLMDPPTNWYTPTLTKVIRKHLHTTSELNTHPIALSNPGITRWKSHDTHHLRMGALELKDSDFMVNSHTWINYTTTPNANTQISAAITAIKTSTLPARIVALVATKILTALPPPHCNQTITIATLGHFLAGALKLTAPRIPPPGKEKSVCQTPTTYNTNDLTIVLIQNDLAQPFNRQALTTDIADAIPPNKHHLINLPDPPSFKKRPPPEISIPTSSDRKDLTFCPTLQTSHPIPPP